MKITQTVIFLACVYGGADAQGCTGNEPLKWYPSGGSDWPSGYCKFERNCGGSDGSGYSTELACCTGFFGGQVSGVCLTKLPAPPTTSPTISGGLVNYWYPDYGTAWPDAGCLNTLPLPFNRGDRPEYGTQIECCKAAYGGQSSGKCLSQLASPPTTSPTISGGLAGFWYPDYESAWSDAGCKSDLPLPFNRGDRPEYATQFECCKAAYGGQMSGKCLSELASPPTTSPTMAGGVGTEWYPDYSSAWSDAGCKADLPVPSGRPTYGTHIECCKGAYGGQMSGKCVSELATPPTTSPTMEGGLGDKWYPDYSLAWADAGCKADVPLPFNDGDRPVYDSHIECCKNAYGGQMSGKCLSELATPPTTSPTMEGGVGDKWYPDYDTAWSEAGCKADLPLPFTENSRPMYDTHLECCKAAYGGQTSGKCLSELATPPTTSPTAEGGVGDKWYPDYDTAWSEAGCKAELPVPSGRPTYDTQFDCCKNSYGGQVSGKCVSGLATPPTTSPTTTGNVGSVYYPDYTKAWPNGVCINKLPMPSGRPTYSTINSCCSGAYGGQTSQACLCDANPCHSCACGNAASCSSLTCS